MVGLVDVTGDEEQSAAVPKQGESVHFSARWPSESIVRLAPPSAQKRARKHC